MSDEPSLRALIRKAREAGHDTLGIATDPEGLLALSRACRRVYFRGRYRIASELAGWIIPAAHATHLPTNDEVVRTALVRELACARVTLELLPPELLDSSMRDSLKNTLVAETRYDYREAVADLLTNDRAAIEAEIKTALKEKKHDEVG